MAKADNLIWIDLEMTGLDPDEERIIEIATIVTDKDLNILAEGPSLVISQPLSLLDNMSDWCVKHHGESGLTERVKQSNISEQEAEQQTLDFLQQWSSKGDSPMCGNSVGQDRRFMVRYMPALHEFFHYRNIDVSSFKEVAKRWKPEILSKFSKTAKHLAMDDIKESIDELAFYRQHFIKLD